MRCSSSALAFALGLLLASCGTSKKSAEEEPNPFGPTGIPEELRGDGRNVRDATPVIPGGNVNQGPLIPDFDDDNVMFTDADNPDANAQELSEILAYKQDGPWTQSEEKALRQANRSGKPLLIWFADSKGSPASAALSAELFGRNEFGDWADENIVRLKVDSTITLAENDLSLGLGDEMNQRMRIKDYTERLHKKYKVSGSPQLLLLSSDGKVVNRIRGYKSGNAAFLFGQLKHSVDVANKEYSEWRQSLEKKGYRLWSDPRGRTFFAKLAKYSNGELLLISPDGTRARTKEAQLSKVDRDWLTAQKEARGIQ